MSGEEQRRRVLLVGSHLDGQWVDSQEGASSYRAYRPFKFEFPADPKQTTIPAPEFVDYRLERVPIAMRSAHAVVWIGISSDLVPGERDLAIVRALFQRDVVQLFREEL